MLRSLIQWRCGSEERAVYIEISLSETWLARHLQHFGIAPRNIRIGSVQAKGYYLADFNQAFACVLNNIQATDPDSRT